MSRIDCPNCGKSYQLPAEKHAQFAGKKTTCKECGQVFVVPPPAPGAAEGGARPQAAAPVQRTMPTAAPAPAPAPTPVAPPARSAPPPLPRQAPRAAAAPTAAKTPMEMYEQNMYQGGGGELENNGWAKGALVAGIAGVFIPVVAALIAIGCGIIGLLKARKPNVGGRNIALLGIGLALLGVFLHVMLALAIVPKVKTVIAVGKRVICSAHLAVIGQELEKYAKNNNGHFPDSIDQLLVNSPNLHPSFFVCPATNDTAAPGATSTEQAAALNQPGHMSYVYVGKGQIRVAPAATTKPAATAAAAPTTATASTDQSDDTGDETATPFPNKPKSDVVLMYEPPANHGTGGMNVLWGDGRISYVDSSSATKIIAELKVGHNPPAKPPGGWKTDSDGIIPD